MNVISLTSLLRHSFRTTASLSVPFFNCVEFMLLHVSFGLFFTHLQFLPFNQTTSFSYPRLSHQTGLLRSVHSICINFVSTSLILLKYFHCLIPLITVIIPWNQSIKLIKLNLIELIWFHFTYFNVSALRVALRLSVPSVHSTSITFSFHHLRFIPSPFNEIELRDELNQSESTIL